MCSLRDKTRFFFVTADDRTGALEIGGVLASRDRSIGVGPRANDPDQCVVDIESRHSDASTATSRMVRAHENPAKFRAHKMDSGLRGNWTHESKALVELGFKVAIVPSYPSAGRRCEGGVVYIDDVPLLDSPFGSDPLSAPCSSKPIEVLEANGCLSDEIEVWNANTDEELREAVLRCLQEDRVLVGPTGAIEMLGREIYSDNLGNPQTLRKPILIACGSVNTTSRLQIANLNVPQLALDSPTGAFGSVATLSTPMTSERLTTQEAGAMARRFTNAINRFKPFAASMIVIGGDTVASLLGNSTASVIGTIDTGIPVSQLDSVLLATKGGGIGQPDTLKKLVESSD